MKEQEIKRLLTERHGIESLNEMQRQVLEKSNDKGDMVIYSPTGSGKTIAYTIPMLKALHAKPEVLQSVIIAPSRELVLQIFNVIQPIAVGLKVSCCYGGHKVEDERMSLLVTPGIIVATPGRLLDHVHRGHIDIRNTKWLILDEFDKILELGFEEEMRQLLRNMPNLSRRVLTSATVLDTIPDYVRLNGALTLNFLHKEGDPASRMTIWSVASPEKDKLDTLRSLLLTLPRGKSIVFVNYRDAVSRINTYLRQHHIASGVYHGGMEQIEREKAIAMFNNGSIMVLVTTDLASRGLDISEVSHIIHYHLPVSPEAYVHRNGRTARVDAEGSVFILMSPDEDTPDYIKIDDAYELNPFNEHSQLAAEMATIYINAGRKEKISRGDIVGYILANSDLQSTQIGAIDLRDHYALVAVPRAGIRDLVLRLKQAKLKGKKVLLSLAEQS